MPQAEATRTTTGRLTGADFIRSLACLGVLIHHLAQKLDPTALPPFWRPVHTALITGAFGVAAFFVLSGYLLARPFWQALDAGRPMPSLKTYFIRRFARIAPGFWAALTVSFVLSLAVFGATFDLNLILRFLAGLSFVSSWHWLTLFPVEANGPLWSIGFEVASYVLLPAGLVLLFFGRRFGLRGWPARLAWIGVIALALGVHALFLSVIHIGNAGTGWQYGLVGGARQWMPEYNPIGFFAIFAIGALAGGVEVALARRRGLVFDMIFITGAALAVYAVGPTFRTGIAEGWGWLGIPYAFPLFPIGIGTMLAAGPSTVWIERITEAAPLPLHRPDLVRYLYLALSGARTDEPAGVSLFPFRRRARPRHLARAQCHGYRDQPHTRLAVLQTDRSPGARLGTATRAQLKYLRLFKGLGHIPKVHQNVK